MHSRLSREQWLLMMHWENIIVGYSLLNIFDYESLLGWEMKYFLIVFVILNPFGDVGQQYNLKCLYP